MTAQITGRWPVSDRSRRRAADVPRPVPHVLAPSALAAALEHVARLVAVLVAARRGAAGHSAGSATSVLETLRAVARSGVAVMASLHQVHLAIAHADRVIALRAGRVVANRPVAGIDGAALAQIYGREGVREARA